MRACASRTFVEVGGNRGAVVGDAGSSFCKTVGGDTGGVSSAATCPLPRSGMRRLHLPASSNVRYQYVGLAAAGKDISKDERIYKDKDVWLMSCDTGGLCCGGEWLGARGRVDAGSVITVEWDQTRVNFLKNGVLHGEMPNAAMPGAVKLVVSLAYKDNSVLLL